MQFTLDAFLSALQFSRYPQLSHKPLPMAGQIAIGTNYPESSNTAPLGGRRAAIQAPEEENNRHETRGAALPRQRSQPPPRAAEPHGLICPSHRMTTTNEVLPMTIYAIPHTHDPPLLRARARGIELSWVSFNFRHNAGCEVHFMIIKTNSGSSPPSATSGKGEES